MIFLNTGKDHSQVWFLRMGQGAAEVPVTPRIRSCACAMLARVERAISASAGTRVSRRCQWRRAA